MKLTIGITDCGAKFPIYENWILSQLPNNEEFTISTIKLSYEVDNLIALKNCDGILLTGGEDIHPKYYCKSPEEVSQYLALCNPNFMNEKRDEFEWKVCEYIFENKTPVLGVCRGLQLVNVFLGGTLIPDIPTTGKNNHSKFYEGKDRYHAISVLPETELSKITNSASGQVNSAHHQSAATIANSLKINALSDDEIMEGLEYNNKNSQFLMLVQWHPERLLDMDSAFSKNLKEAFIDSLRKV